MEPNKIMTNIMSSYSRFVADMDGEYYFLGGGNAGGYGIQLKSEHASNSEQYLYYVALLNSSVLEFYHKHIAPIFGGKYNSYNKRYLEPHPVVLPDNTSKEAIVDTAAEIKNTREEITELEYKTSDIHNYLPDYEHSSSILDLAQSIDLSGDDYRQGPIRKDVKTEPESTERVYQVVMKRGHSMGFEDEYIRDFAFRVLTAQDGRLSRSEILNMETPSHTDVADLMSEYHEDVEEIGVLSEKFDQLCNDLDQMVLRDVYDLSTTDKNTVNEFLEVW